MDDARLVEIVGRLGSGNVACYFGNTADLSVTVFPDEVALSKKWITGAYGKRVRVTVEVTE